MTQSKLDSYLSNKDVTALESLGQGTTESSGSIVSYPWPWANPKILSKTDAYEVTRHLILPVEFQNLAFHYKEYRVQADHERKYLALISSNNIDLYFYTSDPILIKLTVPTPIRFFHLLNQTTAIAVTTGGEVYYWKDINEDAIHYTISLLSNKEHITAVEPVDANQVVIGTSTGEIYSLSITTKDTIIDVSTFYKPTGVVSYITGIFQTPLPHISQVELRAHTEPVLKFKVLKDMVYVVSKKHLLVWKIHSFNKVEFVSHIDLGVTLLSSVFQHFQSNATKDQIKLDILDLGLITDRECVALVSYSVPALGDYVQFVLVSFTLQSFFKQAQVDYTSSIPYTAVAGTTSPTLSVTKTLGFVTFKQTLIAVSLDPRSVFEESVVLKNDAILSVSVYEEKDTNRALIYTLSSGVIEFKVDIDEILAQRDTGNVYARVVPSIMDRDTVIFMSKLEQAVYFGASKQSPLSFPLKPEKVDISHAVKMVSDKIMNTESKLLPSKQDITLFLESRFVFEKQIMIVLKESFLMDTIPQNIRNELFKRVEFYLLSLILWEFHQERAHDSVTLEYWERTIADVLEPKDNIIQNLLINHPFRILDFVNKVRSKVLIQGKKVKNAQEHMTLIYTTNKIMMRATKETYLFETAYRKDYKVPVNYDDSVSVQLNDMIYLLFELNVEYIVNNSSDDSIMNSDYLKRMKESLYDLSVILLDILLEAAKNTKINVEQYQSDYESVRKSVIEGLCKCGLSEKAIILGAKHNDVQSLVMTIHTSSGFSSETIQEKDSKFIGIFKQDYFSCLLKYLDKDSVENEKVILALLSKHPGYATDFLNRNSLQVAWKFYLQKKDYKRALEAIQVLVQQEEDQTKLNEYSSWMKIFEAALLQ
ncbi:hypothetical protein EDC94DRAFT_607372 [Helicostylum pulchrum]|nr:hypothetical protein EDC94DRAFT_607372 [Helicostylum pulchrum]